MRLKDFTCFILERDAIRWRREHGCVPPWTTDKILSTYRFCNVDREHDRVTRWIDIHIRRPYARSPVLWFNLCLARLFNWPDTLAEIGFVSRWDRTAEIDILDSCQAVQEHTGKVFTGAYIVSTNGVRMPKAKYIVERVLRPLWAAGRTRPRGGAQCNDWADWLMQQNGFSDFLANQVVTDMKYTPILRDAEDVSNFVLAGPGTKRGLNRYLGRELNASWNAPAARQMLTTIRRDVLTVLPEHTRTFQDLNNLSNCFCEWDKYERVRLGQGRPRSKYTPAQAAL